MFIIYLLGLWYLARPTPPVPDLPGGIRSDEPGDTWQNPTQEAFFTDMTRAQVLEFYQQAYRVEANSVRFPVMTLNYPPEDTAVWVRRHIDSYWLEEIVHPLRESIFVNGWTPRLAPVNADKTPDQLEKIKIIFKGQIFQSKITIRWYESPLWARVITWTLIFPVSLLILGQLRLNLAALIKARHS